MLGCLMWLKPLPCHKLARRLLSPCSPAATREASRSVQLLAGQRMSQVGLCFLSTCSSADSSADSGQLSCFCCVCEVLQEP